MSADTHQLRDIFLDVAGEATLTERQEEGPSRDPIEEPEAELVQELSSFTRENGLDDALKGAESTA